MDGSGLHPTTICTITVIEMLNYNIKPGAQLVLKGGPSCQLLFSGTRLGHSKVNQ